MKAYDLLIQAESGLANINGSPDQPGRVGVSVCDSTWHDFLSSNTPSLNWKN